MNHYGRFNPFTGKSDLERKIWLWVNTGLLENFSRRTGIAVFNNVVIEEK